MEVAPPVAVLLDVLGHVLGDEDVAGVTAIHYSLGNIDPRASDVGAATDVYHAAHWSTVNTHPQLEFRMLLRFGTDLQCAFHWRFRRVVKDERHSVARWHS